MTSASRKDRLAKDSANYPAAVSLEACPTCGAAVGELCHRRFGGKTIAMVNPHPSRVEASKPLDPRA